MTSYESGRLLYGPPMTALTSDDCIAQFFHVHMVLDQIPVVSVYVSIFLAVVRPSIKTMGRVLVIIGGYAYSI